jgi:predicted CXXCH cytochrome family protein
MRLDNDATVCKVCHLSTYEQWQSSEHGRSNVTCTGCHQVHSQNLRMDSESLCTSCHSEPLASFPHNVHTADGVKCIDCHVPAAMTATGAQPASATVSTPNHVFMAAATTCVGCHSLAKPASVTTLQVQETHSEAESLLASQVQGLEKEKGLLEKASVVGVGLGLGFGAVLGIALTMIVSYAIQRRAQT